MKTKIQREPSQRALDVASRATLPSRDSIFRIINAASRFEVRARKRAQRTRPHRITLWLLVLLEIAPALIAFALAFVGWLSGSRYLFVWSRWTLLFAYLGALLYPILSVWVHRKSLWSVLKHPFGVLLGNAMSTAAVDMLYLPRLMRKPLDKLEVVMIELKAERDSFERRISLVVGAIEKVGLAPGLLATIISLQNLKPGQSKWIYGLAYGTPLLYIFGAVAHFLVMRLDRMTKLLELAIARKKVAQNDQPPTQEVSTLPAVMRPSSRAQGPAGRRDLED
jgi:hypothetical protein